MAATAMEPATLSQWHPAASSSSAATGPQHADWGSDSDLRCSPEVSNSMQQQHQMVQHATSPTSEGCIHDESADCTCTCICMPYVVSTTLVHVAGAAACLAVVQRPASLAPGFKRLVLVSNMVLLRDARCCSRRDELHALLVRLLSRFFGMFDIACPQPCRMNVLTRCMHHEQGV
jgi:hypothetical protein